MEHLKMLIFDDFRWFFDILELISARFTRETPCKYEIRWIFFILEAIIYEYITKILYFIAINRLERISVIFEIWDGGQNFGVITAHLP